jgi:hypothetical protein
MIEQALRLERALKRPSKLGSPSSTGVGRGLAIDALNSSGTVLLLLLGNGALCVSLREILDRAGAVVDIGDYGDVLVGPVFSAKLGRNGL